MEHGSKIALSRPSSLRRSLVAAMGSPSQIIQGPTGSLMLDLGAIPVNPPTAVVPGDTWNFQCWYRDLNPTLTSNFSDGLTITFF